jgi:acetyltransferase-like isoleucine patch superfamily enzyme
MQGDIYIHPTALVETTHLGEGTRVWALAHILKGATVGKNCNIGDHCFIESGVVIGDNVTIKNGNMLWEGVTLEAGVFVGPHVFFTNDLYPRSARHPAVGNRYENRDWLVPTLVKEGASLGAGCIIIAGVTIGKFAMVGAGALITRNVPPHALILGNPPYQRGWVCRCGKPLKFLSGDQTTCECGLTFVQEEEAVRCISDE